jgi:acyl-CoA thioester hydrolase
MCAPNKTTPANDGRCEIQRNKEEIIPTEKAASPAYNPLVDLRQLPLTFEATVDPQHLDLMDHMNIMWYTHFFDRAIWGFYETFGFGQEYHTTSGFGSFGLEMYTRHLAELRAGDRIRIYTRAIARNAKLIHYIHFMERERDGQLAATSELLGIHIDLATRRNAPLPEHIGTALDEIIARHRGLDWPAPLSGAIRVK